MNIKIDKVHAEMLKEILRKWRMKDTDFVEEHIQEVYSNLFGKKK